jgi:hypothetical protein
LDTAEDLEQFNDHIIGAIELIASSLEYPIVYALLLGEFSQVATKPDVFNSRKTENIVRPGTVRHRARS